jgi:lipopolysaccharide exporter
MASPPERNAEVSSSLGHRIAKSAAWMVGSRVAVRGIGLISTMILARLLRPEDFGLIALASALVGVVDTLGNFSFDLALIREAKAGRDHYDTVWTLTIVRGAVVAVAIVALAAPAAILLDDPRIELITYVLAAAVLLEALQNVGIVDFRKELNFHQEFAFQLYAKVASFTATIGLAVVWQKYWALVVGIIVGKVASLILSYIMHPFRPQLRFTEWRPLVGFSKWLLLSNIGYFLAGSLDKFVLGRLAGAHALGLYEISSEISNLPTGELIWPIQRALYPGYAKLTEDLSRLSNSYVGSLAIISTMAIPAAVGIASVAGLIVRVFLGDQWVESIELLQVLALGGIFKIGYANAGTVLLALGRAKLISHLAAVHLATLAALVIGGTIMGGPLGTAWGVAGAAALMLTIYITIMLRLLSIPFRVVALAVWRTLAASAIMALAVQMLCAFWPTNILPLAIAELFAVSVIGMVTYIGTLLAIWWMTGSPSGPEREALSAIAQLVRRYRAANQEGQA